MNLKRMYEKWGVVIRPILYLKNRIISVRIKSVGRNNTVNGIERCRMKSVKVAFNGNNNTVIIGDMSTLQNVSFRILGSNNRVILGARCCLSGCSFCVEDNENIIELGEHVYIYINTEISVIENTKITIGADCLFSANCMIRTGDSHGIYSTVTGIRTNSSQSILFGNHVWMGNGCKILKGAEIEEGCVIGAGSLVTKNTKTAKNSVIVGIPAKVVQSNIEWTHER